MCSLSYHALNSASTPGAMFIALSNSPPALRAQLVARQDLLALEAHEALDPGGDALGPRRQVLAADGQVGRARHHGERLEVVGRHGDPAVLRPDPALAQEKTGHALPFRQVLGVVPVVELVLGGPAMFIAAIRVPLAIG